MRITHLVSALVVSLLLVGCAGTKSVATPPTPTENGKPPSVSPPTPAPVTTFGSPVPPGWTRVKGADKLINTPRGGTIEIDLFKTGSSTPSAIVIRVVKERFHITPVFAELIVASDKLRASFWLLGTVGTKLTGSVSRIIVRRVPKLENTPADITVVCIGTWPAEHDAELRQDLSAFIDGFTFH